MPGRAPVGKIRSPDDQAKDVTVVCSVRIWYCGHNGYLWFHPSAVINIPPIYGNTNITIQTHDGEVVLVTMYWSGCLLEVDDGWLNSGVLPILCVIPDCVHDTYRPSYFSSWLQDLSRLFRTRHPIPSDTLTK